MQFYISKCVSSLYIENLTLIFCCNDMIMLSNTLERCLVYKNDFGMGSVVLKILLHVPNLEIKFGFERFSHSREGSLMKRFILVVVMVEILKTFSLK